VLDVGDAIFVLVDQVGLGPPLVHVPFAHLEPVGDVSAGLREDKRNRLVVSEVRVNERRFGAGAVLRVEDARQRLVRDLDQLDPLLRDLRRVGRHRGHRLADVAHAIQGEDAAILQIEAGVAGEVLPCHHHAHARQRPGFAHIDALDNAVRDGAAFEHPVEQVRSELHVIHIRRRARHLLTPLDALRAGADERRTSAKPPCGTNDGRRTIAVS
jgi:hypothetical protein